MLRCLELAQKAKGFTAPNPMVGAILVYNNRIIGEGWHQHYGEAHAEINCLNNVLQVDKHLISESTMYVNLEPCAHNGNTPPCSVRLAEEKVKKVVICNKDPFEKVNGKGIQNLINNNIKIKTDLLTHAGLWLNRRFFCFHELRRPYIILKWAKTLDNFIGHSNQQIQISNTVCNHLVHKWRTEEAAILIGTKTALCDNPQLNARLWHGKNPLRIILDRELKIPVTNNVFDNTANTWIINEKRHETINNINYIKLTFNHNTLKEIMKLLFESKIISLIVEGGSQLLNSFIEAELWDEARIFTGNTTLGNGIQSPSLTNSELVLTTKIEDNKIQLFTNKNNKYPFYPSLEL